FGALLASWRGGGEGVRSSGRRDPRGRWRGGRGLRGGRTRPAARYSGGWRAMPEPDQASPTAPQPSSAEGMWHRPPIQVGAVTELVGEFVGPYKLLSIL